MKHLLLFDLVLSTSFRFFDIISVFKTFFLFCFKTFYLFCCFHFMSVLN